ncbi:MAG: VWA domain-containing protein [Gammaproteobacteria bacterium]|nr:VWA domain-containing protein [Gammaproteobacteria bacterium]MDD9897215.1 VWA domain-containing protein [Gammaproteobacteria bacterium]MDD9959156.1 VWA domain-containing protein [Gammaproteobacteria bacterium]
MASNSKINRRKVNPLSLAFLDVMFCGFGAVILIFLILDHASTISPEETSPELLAEINLLREEVEEGQLGLVRIRNTLSDVDFEVVTAEGLARQIMEQIDTFLQELAALENSSMATVEDLARLRSDIEALEQEVLRLQASAFEQEGNSVRQFLGDGNRQYLSGLFLGGQRILILLDSSASMLDSTIVNIIRTRNMSDERKRNAPKWQRVVSTVDWISTQLPITSQYQIWNFNTGYQSVISGTEDNWLEVADRDQLNQAIENVRAIVPNNGTNMEQVFIAVANMSPRPDNIFLITDGLPTLNNRGSSEPLVTPGERVELFEEAVEELPQSIPVNIVLMPLEGDPSAAAVFWQLAQYTRGSFLTPSKDWP